jgi:hypothetical protein
VATPSATDTIVETIVAMTTAYLKSLLTGLEDVPRNRNLFSGLWRLRVQIP